MRRGVRFVPLVPAAGRAESRLLARVRARLDNRVNLYLALGGGFERGGDPEGAPEGERTAAERVSGAAPGAARPGGGAVIRRLRFFRTRPAEAGAVALLLAPGPESASRAASALPMPIRARVGDRENRCPGPGGRFGRGGDEVGEYAPSGTSPGFVPPGAVR